MVSWLPLFSFHTRQLVASEEPEKENISFGDKEKKPLWKSRTTDVRYAFLFYDSKLKFAKASLFCSFHRTEDPTSFYFLCLFVEGRMYQHNVQTGFKEATIFNQGHFAFLSA